MLFRRKIKNLNMSFVENPRALQRLISPVNTKVIVRNRLLILYFYSRTISKFSYYAYIILYLLNNKLFKY